MIERAPSAEASKADWRAWARKARRSMDVAAAGVSVVAGLRTWAGLSGTVLVYLPMPNEIDVTSLINAGITPLVTRTPPVGPLTVHPLDVPMERHRYGFLQPADGAEAADPASIDVALVPGLVFDRRGGRLGHGAGYYDGLCAGLRFDARRVGITLDAFVFDVIPEDAHDVRMTHLATESGVVAAVS